MKKLLFILALMLTTVAQAFEMGDGIRFNFTTIGEIVILQDGFELPEYHEYNIDITRYYPLYFHHDNGQWVYLTNEQHPYKCSWYYKVEPISGPIDNKGFYS